VTIQIIPAPVVRQTWIDPFAGGTEIRALHGFRLARVEDPLEGFAVQILTRPSGTSALVSDEIAEVEGVRQATSETELRAALAAAGIEMNGADHLFFLPDGRKEEVRAADDAPHVRRLTAADEALFAAFEESAPEADVDEAWVELDHWAVFGAFDGDLLVAAGSAVPFREDSLLADIGVLTLPSRRGQGHARAIVLALARHALAQGYEPQYRCQLDNTSSVILAERSGFLSIGTWDVPLPVEGDDEG
jgi:GNAT superfamily N-acetyltransferase